MSDFFISSCKASYLSCRKLTALQGEVKLQSDGIIFHFKSKDYEKLNEENLKIDTFFSFEKIISINEILGEIELVLKNTDDFYGSNKIIIHCTNIKETFLRLYSQNKSSTSIQQFKAWLLSKTITTRILLLGSLLALTVLSFFKTLPYLYLLIPNQAEQKLGDYVMDSFKEELPLCKDPKTLEILNRLKNKLAKPKADFSYKIYVVKNNIANALAFPGGHIVIFSGLLNESKSIDEIAGVLAHEMSHVYKRHSFRRLVQITGTSIMLSLILSGNMEELEMLDNMESLSDLGTILLALKFSRQYEKEADKLAMERLKIANINYKGFLSFFQRMDSKIVNKKVKNKKKENTNKKKLNGIVNNILNHMQNWASTHPDNLKRIAAIKEESFNRKAPFIKLLHKNEKWNIIKKACSK